MELPTGGVAGHGRVDPAAPWPSGLGSDRRQLEVQRLTVGVEDQVDQQLGIPDLRSHRQAVRRLLPVGLVQFHAMPGTMRFPEQLIQAHVWLFGLHLPQQPSSVQ